MKSPETGTIPPSLLRLAPLPHASLANHPFVMSLRGSWEVAQPLSWSAGLAGTEVLVRKCPAKSLIPGPPALTCFHHIIMKGPESSGRVSTLRLVVFGFSLWPFYTKDC